MARITNSINLQDRMTPTLRAINRAMGSTVRAMQVMDRQLNTTGNTRVFDRATQDIQRANNELLRMENNVRRASSETDGLATSASRVNTYASQWGSFSFNLLNISAALHLIDRLGTALGNLMAAPDAARSTQARLGLFNESEFTNQELYGQIYRTANATRTDIQATGDLASRILISGAMQGPNAAQGALQVTDLINRALVAGGGTSEENRRALLQLSQALASGNLQGDELRAIREQTPYLANILAEGLGNVDERFIGTTIGDLKDLGAAGELTASTILQSFVSMEDEIQAAFEQMPRTFSQATTVMNNVWTYFLTQLGETDGILARLNDRMWEFVDFLASAAGADFLAYLASGMTVLGNLALWVTDGMEVLFTFLSENINVATALFAGLGAMAAFSAGLAIVAWVAAAWPILAVIGLVALLVYGLLELGATVGDIVGAIAGAFLFLGGMIWDLGLLAVNIVGVVLAVAFNIAVAIATGINLVFYGLWQGILWVVTTIVNVITVVGQVLATVFMVAYIAVESVISGIVNLFGGLGISVLEILSWIASGIDSVFGSNLQGAVDGWISNVTGALRDFNDWMDVEGDVDATRRIWSDTNLTSYSDMSLGSTFDDILRGFDDNIIDISNSEEWLSGYSVNPTEGFTTGWDWGHNIFDADTGGIADSMSNITDLLGGFDPSTIDYVDSVGNVDQVKGDINLSDQDIQLLRDMSAREFLLNLQTVTPQANITFGDVRETADARQILGVIEEMVQEQMATRLSER